MASKREEARDALFEKIKDATEEIPGERHATIEYTDHILKLAQAYREVAGKPAS